MDIKTTREQGLGAGFQVMEPHDGFRQNNQLWFGKCSECGETVTNSTLNGIWEHTVYTRKEFWSREKYEKGIWNSSTSHQVPYCPTAEGRHAECEIVVKVA